MNEDIQVLTLRLLVVMLAGWTAMLAIGVIHAEIDPAVHACGYGTAFLLTTLITLTVVAMNLAWETD